MLSYPPAMAIEYTLMATSMPSFIIGCAAKAIACKPDEQNRFIVAPATGLRFSSRMPGALGGCALVSAEFSEGPTLFG